MSGTEKKTLGELEAVIERRKAAYIEVGNALREIQKRRLYCEQGYNTFEAYCRERWGFSRSVGYDYIKAASVAENVGTSLQSTPSFSQAVALARLAPEKQKQVAGKMDLSTISVRELSQTVADEMHKPVAARTDEWYTPKRYVEAARAVLGSIDLDPSSCERANEVVGARVFYTKRDDGLSKSWSGRVWLNPPYGHVVPQFVSKLIADYEAGNVSEAILLVNSQSTDRRWFQRLFDYTICFTDHRLKFWNENGSGDRPKNGSAFVYFGNNPSLFQMHFSEFGAVVQAVPASLPLSVAA